MVIANLAPTTMIAETLQQTEFLVLPDTMQDHLTEPV